MEIIKSQEGDQLTVALTGRLDATTAPSLAAELEMLLTGVRALTVDLTRLAYISSAGLRVLLAAKKIMTNQQGTIVLRHPTADVREVLDITGFGNIVGIE